MRDHHIDLCGQIDFTRTEAMPLLARDAHFSFACNGCGDCCRGREDIVLSGFDLWRIAARLRLPPQIVARGYCRASIGTVSHLPVLRLAPVKENRNNCPFLTGDHCAIHDAEPLVCALYPLAQEISRKGQVSYFLQPTGCGGQVIEARVEDHLARYDVPAREQTDVRWATRWNCWKRCSARCWCAGCRTSSGRRCILATTMPHRSCRSWRKTCTGWMLNLQNWQNISKNGITHQNNRSIYLMQSIIKAVLGQK